MLTVPGYWQTDTGRSGTVSKVTVRGNKLVARRSCEEVVVIRLVMSGSELQNLDSGIIVVWHTPLRNTIAFYTLPTTEPEARLSENRIKCTAITENLVKSSEHVVVTVCTTSTV
jgi:hypothetical protein